MGILDRLFGGRFTMPPPEETNLFDQWLARFGKRFLHLDSGGENYDGFIVDTDRLEDVIELAERAGIHVRLESF
ncbi:hypothetical protein [Pseudomonas sp. NIBRBAC000502773]|uniref:DUF6630 family protein n=1 Tax=Pseudomonas sp. NIBRBAC000502773 TaxID=2590776 RepID=UPI001130550A|nr:hypothetical protein [Pseudomonas sp. NIBRBAC000502773]QDG60396.1 hypothetical protein NIBR502773_29015 [Pseudomonas sp. NIBRBAC000502773]